eukprot:3237021-Alexandrium_andersonii.AAC.1
MPRQTTVNISHCADDALWKFPPCDERVLRERAFGRSTSTAVGPESFKAALKKRGAAKRKFAGQWSMK